MLRLIKHIIIGWGKRYGFLPTSEAEKALSNLRMERCGRCQFGSKTKLLQLLNGHAHYQADIACTKCGCPVLQKTLVVAEKCPEGKW